IDRIPIQIVMTENPITIFADATIPQAAQIMVENGISGLPVERDRDIIGMITSRDLVKFFSEQEELKARVGDLMSKEMITVHRHHTISHILDEMNLHGVGRALVYEDNNTPVGIITRSGLTFSQMMGPKDEMELKNIKMTRKESPAGRKQYRYIRQLPLVAEDIMTSPIRTINPDIRAVDAAKILVENHLMGMPVLEKNDMAGYFSANEIVAEIARW
ncbi:MAG: CBS domain-containing protein, partial [Methanotrichaceae archaeon]|nr:CBS domain-containing protein [Methanotrichaceae archaeon]